MVSKGRWHPCAYALRCEMLRKYKYTIQHKKFVLTIADCVRHRHVDTDTSAQDEPPCPLHVANETQETPCKSVWGASAGADYYIYVHVCTLRMRNARAWFGASSVVTMCWLVCVFVCVCVCVEDCCGHEDTTRRAHSQVMRKAPRYLKRWCAGFPSRCGFHVAHAPQMTILWRVFSYFKRVCGEGECISVIWV